MIDDVGLLNDKPEPKGMVDDIGLLGPKESTDTAWERAKRVVSEDIPRLLTLRQPSGPPVASAPPEEAIGAAAEGAPYVSESAPATPTPPPVASVPPAQPVEAQGPLSRAARMLTDPFKLQGLEVTGAFLRGGAALTKGVTDVGEYVGKPLGIPRSEVFDQAAQLWAEKGEELTKLAETKGAGIVDQVVGEAIGGAVPGVAEFMLNVPYAALKGAFKAKEQGDNQWWSAIVEGAKRFVLGKSMESTRVLTRPASAVAMGGIMATQTAAEGGTPKDIAKSFGVGTIFGATSGSGPIGVRDIGREVVPEALQMRSKNVKEWSPEELRTILTSTSEANLDPEMVSAFKDLPGPEKKAAIKKAGLRVEDVSPTLLGKALGRTAERKTTVGEGAEVPPPPPPKEPVVIEESAMKKEPPNAPQAGEIETGSVGEHPGDDGGGTTSEAGGGGSVVEFPKKPAPVAEEGKEVTVVRAPPPKDLPGDLRSYNVTGEEIEIDEVDGKFFAYADGAEVAGPFNSREEADHYKRNFDETDVIPISKGKRPAKKGELRPVPHEVSDSPVSPPGDRWTGDRGAMPGEPSLLLDGDAETAKAAIVEVPNDKGEATWEARNAKGESLGQFTDLNDAAKAAEAHVDKPTERRSAPRPVQSGYPESEVPDLPTVESDIAAVSTSLKQMREEYAKKKAKDPSSMDTLALADRGKVYRESLDKLQARKAELQKAVAPPPSTDADKTAPEREKEVQRISNRYRAIDDKFTESGAPRSASLLLDAIDTGKYNDVLHPRNKISRNIFYEITGQKLPAGVGATQKFFTLKPFEKKAAWLKRDTISPVSSPEGPGKKEPAGTKPLQPEGGITETPEFRKWFGKSQVIDESGKPRVMYHGTATDFSEHKVMPTELPSGEAFWFSFSPRHASGYSVNGPKGTEGSNVRPVYVKAEKIFDPVSYETHEHTSKQKKDALLFNKWVKERIKNDEDVAVFDDKYPGYDMSDGHVSYENNEWLIEKAKEAGYDAIVTTDGNGEIGLGVFDAGQVRSIFDPNPPGTREGAPEVSPPAMTPESAPAKPAEVIQEAAVAAKKEGIPLKEQKKYLVSELEDLQKKAPMGVDVPKEITELRTAWEKARKQVESVYEAFQKKPSDESRAAVSEAETATKQAWDEYGAAGGTVTIDVPGDGAFTVHNTQEALASFAKRVKAEFPVKIMEGTRVSTHSKEQKEAKVKAIPDMVESAKGLGWHSNGHFLVKGEPKIPPKSYSEREPLNQKGVDQVLSAAKKAKPRPVEKVEFVQSGEIDKVGGKHEAISDKPIPEVEGTNYSYVRLTGKSGNEVYVDQNYYLYMMKHFPDAKAFVALEENPAMFKSGGEIVGLIMPIRTNEGVRDIRYPELKDAVEAEGKPKPLSDIVAIDKRYPVAGDEVAGLKVRSDIPNQASIAATLTEYEILKGVREVPFSDFDGPAALTKKIEGLAAEISRSGEISPLIVVYEKEGPYILEGSHRFDALQSLGKSSFPALVVVDTESIPSEIEAKGETIPTPEPKIEEPTPPVPLVRSRAKNAIYFEKPFVGPSGAKVIGYNWNWKWDLAERGADKDIKEVRVSDWEEAKRNPETGRDIVHEFYVETPDGKSHSVSAESAARMLGWDPARVKKMATSDPAFRRISLERKKAILVDELKKVKEQGEAYRSAVEESKKIAKPPITKGELLKSGGAWWHMGDARVLQHEPGEMNAERKSTLESAWLEKRIAEKGYSRPPAGSISVLETKIAKTDRDLAGLPAPTDKISDFGEKIGGARKDTAERGFSTGKKVAAEDTAEPWRKKYVAMEKIDGSGWTIGKKGDSFGISARTGQKFSTQEEAEKAIPLFAVAESHRIFENPDNTFSIFKKVGDRKRFKVVNKDFPSREEAMRYMAEHAETILNTKTTFGEEILPVPEIAVRKGVERRTGPATSKMFMETFAPRGIEFGNWNNQEERQQVMDHAYDGLLDLAETLNLSPKALMLNGDLAIAFGARGQGLTGAKAHYERDYGVINLTKMKGAGSLAHEWFHALDHYLARQDTKASSEKVKNERGDLVYKATTSKYDLQSHGPSTRSKLREELRVAYRSLIESMYHKGEQYVEDTKKAETFIRTARENLRGTLDSIRTELSRDSTHYWRGKGGHRTSKKGLEPASAEQIAEFDRLANILVEGGDLETTFRYNDPKGEVADGKPAPKGISKSEFGRLMAGRHSNDTLDSINTIIKSVRNRTGFTKEGSGDLDRVRQAMKTYSQRLKMFEDAKEGKEKTKAVPTSFSIEARKMDQARTGDYWSEPHEMAARAFASYVEDKIAAAGGQSDFLVYQAHGGILLPMIDGFVARPYPEGKEREAINGAFDRFVKTIKVSDGERLSVGEEAEQKLADIVNKAIPEAIPAAGLSVRPVDVVTEKPKYSEKDYAFGEAETEARYKEAHGLKPEPLLGRAREVVRALVNKATREYEHLPRTAEFAPLRTALLRLSKQKGVAADRTVRAMQAITVKFDKVRMGLFERKVLLDDLAEEAKSDHPLPFDFTKESVAAELEKIDRLVNNDPVVHEALSTRKGFAESVKQSYIAAMDAVGFKVADRFTRENYFRHQVIEYANLKGVAGTGKRLRTPTGRGFLKKREGSKYDINTNYLEAEYEVIAQMLYDIEVAKTIKAVDDVYNVASMTKDVGIPEGYVEWQPREGNVFYMAESIPARLAGKLREGAIDMAEIDVEGLRQVIALGGKRKRFIVKQEVADTLNSLLKAKPQGVLLGYDKKVLTGWKVWQLVSPRRFFKYNMRNLTGDADAAFVGNPSTFKKVPQATWELYQVFTSDRGMTPEMREWFKRGGFETTLQAQELSELNKMRIFSHVRESGEPLRDLPVAAFKKYWKTVRLATDFRESVLRYAAFLDYLDQIKADPKGQPKNFGGSIPEEITAIKDPYDKAFTLSNQLLGAYDQVSVMGNAMRDHLFPFWSWKEVNFRRYIQFVKNAVSDKKVAEAVGRKALGAFAKTPYTAWRVGKFLISVTAFWAMLQAWNNLMFPEEEGELDEQNRNRPHIIFGRDTEGKIINFTRVGALGDFLQWFGLDAFPLQVSRWASGKRTLREIALEMAKSPVNVVAQGITPVAKTPAELVSRRVLFPDIFKPRAMRDRGYYLAQSVGLENEYKEVAGLPSEGYEKSLAQFFVYRADPGQNAYSDILQEKSRFLEKIGKSSEGAFISPKSNALYNLRLAIRYKDTNAKEKFMEEYLSLNGTPEGVRDSLKRMHPLGGLSKRDARDFTETLDAEDKDKLAKAIHFHENVLAPGEREIYREARIMRNRILRERR